MFLVMTLSYILSFAGDSDSDLSNDIELMSHQTDFSLGVDENYAEIRIILENNSTQNLCFVADDLRSSMSRWIIHQNYPLDNLEWKPTGIPVARHLYNKSTSKKYGVLFPREKIGVSFRVEVLPQYDLSKISFNYQLNYIECNQLDSGVDKNFPRAALLLVGIAAERKLGNIKNFQNRLSTLPKQLSRAFYEDGGKRIDTGWIKLKVHGRAPEHRS